jgi:hypothetical protein
VPTPRAPVEPEPTDDAGASAAAGGPKSEPGVTDTSDSETASANTPESQEQNA